MASAMPCETPAAEQDKPRERYQPRFFTNTEWAFVNAAVARLIPSDDNGPGAIEAGVPEFIDRQMETPTGTAHSGTCRGRSSPTPRRSSAIS